MALKNYKDILKKAEESQAEKIAAEKERARLEQEEKERKEREAREEAERKEREAREAEEKRRAAEEERKRQEQIEAERKRQEQKAAEERKRAEEEERRRQEEQRLLNEKNARTQNYINQLALLYHRMQDTLKKDKKASEQEIKNLISEFESLTKQDVFLYNSPVYSEACNAYNSLKILLVQKAEKKQKQKKAMKRIRITFAAVLVAGAIGGAIFGIKEYTSTEEYIAKVAEKKSQKEAAAQAKAEEKVEKERLKKLRPGNFGQGGIIIYDKGEYSDGWRYIEVSMTAASDRYWGKPQSVDFVKGLQNGIGNGDINTKLILENFGTDCAAYDAAYYQYGKGYNGWYLPNRDEMELVYKIAGKKYAKRIKKNNPGWDEITYSYWGSLKKNCWTSEMEEPGKAYFYDCTRGIISGSLWHGVESANIYTYKGFFSDKLYFTKCNVRPIRKF